MPAASLLGTVHTGRAGERASSPRPIGERIAIYRNRRGMSQTVLAGLVGRSESWLSQVERGVRGVDRISVLIHMAKALRIELTELVGQSFSSGSGDDAHDYAQAAAIRVALTDTRGVRVVGGLDGEQPDLDALDIAVRELQIAYQAARYVAAGEMATTLIRRSQDAASSASGGDRRRAVVRLSAVYASTAALLSRVGEGSLAWVAADRTISSARSANDPELIAVGLHRLAQALLRTGRVDDAHRIATAAEADLETAAPSSASATSVRGALLLTAAAAAARGNDPRENLLLLRHARELADALGEDRNDHYIPFGPTNVAIHTVSSAVELGDAADAIRQAEWVQLDRLSAALAGRRSQLHLDLAWAYGQQHNDPAAVFSLIEAERIAPEVLRYDAGSRELLRTCLRRERRTAVPGLRQLATRLGIIG